eukprot:1377755-Amorphochlora_amoeboformis.AAC.1
MHSSDSIPLNWMPVVFRHYAESMRERASNINTGKKGDIVTRESRKKCRTQQNHRRERPLRERQRVTIAQRREALALLQS